MPEITTGYRGYSPLVEISFKRKYPGLEAVEVWGRMQIASGEIVYARDLALKTIQELLLTVDFAYAGRAYSAHKYIWEPDRLDNYASIWVTRIPIGAHPENEPGSVWLNWCAYGR